MEVPIPSLPTRFMAILVRTNGLKDENLQLVLLKVILQNITRIIMQCSKNVNGKDV